MVADDDASDAFAASVGVEGVGLLFDVLPLPGSCAFGDGFAEERHECADAGAGEAGIAGEVAFGAEFDGGLFLVFEDLAGGLAIDCAGVVGEVAYPDVEELHLGCVSDEIIVRWICCRGVSSWSHDIY